MSEDRPDSDAGSEAKPVEDAAKPAAEPANVDPVDEPAKPVVEPAKPVEEPAKPVVEPVKPVEAAKPVEEAVPTGVPTEPASVSLPPAAQVVALDDYDDAPPPPPPRRGLGVVLVLVALGCLAFAAQSHAWLANAGFSQDVGFGLIDNYACDARNTGDCEALDNEEARRPLRRARRLAPPLPRGGKCDQRDRRAHAVEQALPKPGLLDHASAAFVPAGKVAFGLLGIAALALVIAGAIAILGRKPQLPVSPCTIAVVALGLDLLAGLIFVATKPGPTSMVGVGPAFWVFGGGVLIGTAGALLLARAIRPVDPDLLADAIDPEEY